ncbi:MAG: response regulator, partial [Synergistaceae bacterium]|nr:response regulator [Synergistaceae bacterium]
MRVLIAEDELLTRMDLRCLLTDAGFDIVGEAKDGLDAVRFAEELRPDLALLDVKMPYLDGIAAARMIISKGYSDCIVMLTAYSDQEYIQNATNAGVYGYLVKPVNVNSLRP